MIHVAISRAIHWNPCWNFKEPNITHMECIRTHMESMGNPYGMHWNPCRIDGNSILDSMGSPWGTHWNLYEIYNGSPHLDLGGFSIDSYMDSNGYPIAFRKIFKDSEDCHCALPCEIYWDPCGNQEGQHWKPHGNQ